MADEAKTAADTTAGSGTSKASGNGTDAHLEPLMRKLGGIESLIGRFGNRLGTLENQIRSGGRATSIQQPDPGIAFNEADPEGSELTDLRNEVAEARRERELDRFMRLSGVTPKDWQEVEGRLGANEQQYHRYRRDSRGRAVLDYFASYDAVWKDIIAERFRAAQAASDQQRTEQDQNRQTAKMQSVISGAGAVGTEADGAPLDISKMTSAEMLQKVLIPAGLVDENDVPSTKPYMG